MENSVSLKTIDRQTVSLESQINGWGADLDREKRPGVPRDKAPGIGPEMLYPDIEPQLQTVKIYRSVEHMQMPPVFGTTCPPVGVSGLLRDAAYKLSEGQFSHWLTLMLADRVNVVEDLVKDLAHGRIPNIYKEMGLAAEWKYNRNNFVRKLAIGGVGMLALIALGARRSRHRRLARS